MVKHNLDNLYREIFDFVYPDIKYLKVGILHKALYLILDNDTSKAENICNIFSITKLDTKDDDEAIIDTLLGKVSRGIASPHYIFDNYKIEIFWIVVVACMLVGAIGCIQFVRRQRNKRRAGNNSKNVEQTIVAPLQPLASAIQPFTVALCLVVPANTVNALNFQHPVNANEIEKLIDNSFYFLCIKLSDSELVEKHLNFTDENILSLSERREVYVRIHIADAQEMLDKKVTYILKRNLPSQRQGIIKKLACLGDLSGLEKFNRV